jgi:hypothetical protein
MRACLCRAALKFLSRMRTKKSMFAWHPCAGSPTAYSLRYLSLTCICILYKDTCIHDTDIYKHTHIHMHVPIECTTQTHAQRLVLDMHQESWPSTTVHAGHKHAASGSCCWFETILRACASCYQDVTTVAETWHVCTAGGAAARFLRDLSEAPAGEVHRKRTGACSVRLARDRRQGLAHAHGIQGARRLCVRTLPCAHRLARIDVKLAMYHREKSLCGCACMHACICKFSCARLSAFARICRKIYSTAMYCSESVHGCRVRVASCTGQCLYHVRMCIGLHLHVQHIILWRKQRVPSNTVDCACL